MYFLSSLDQLSFSGILLLFLIYVLFIYAGVYCNGLHLIACSSLIYSSRDFNMTGFEIFYSHPPRNFGD